MTPPRTSLSLPGAALVIVVVLVTMLMVLIIAFFSLSRLERRASRAYAENVNTNVLADSALNAVIAQIRDATSNLGTQETWASQPGMIRRYDRSGRLVNAFKLYSSDSMVEGSSFDPDDEVPPGNWRSTPALWVDLNEPVIFDRDGDGEPDDEDGDGKDDASYPIIHRAALEDVQGFEAESPPGTYDNQPLPMPVKWLYLLRDGQLVTANGNGNIATVPEATSDNPVVGRVAFWGDDESCKVNINTASEGYFWDLPRTNSQSEQTFSNYQPVQLEFQRYIGHPMMTCLSPILGTWLGDPYDRRSAGRPAAQARLIEIYNKLTPRVEYGGSLKGLEGYPNRGRIDERTARPIELDDDRLYASVDEYVFSATKYSGIRDQNEGLGASRGSEPRDIVEKTRFFLTAHSQAPEVNLFNQPRVALWPIQAEERDRNVVDKLIAFCSSTGDRNDPTPYYFQRPTVHRGNTYSSSQSPTDFWNVDRNRELYEYLSDLMSRSVPGFGGSMRSEFQADTDQVLVSMIDYMRSGLNTYALNRDRDRNNPSYFYAPPRNMGGVRGARGESQVIPLQLGDNMGFGRNVTVTEAALVLYPGLGDRKYDESRYVQVRTPAGNKHAYKTTEVRAFLLLEFFTPSVGLPAWSPYLDIEVKGLDQFEITDTAGGGSAQSLNMPPTAKVLSHTPIGLGPGFSRHANQIGSGHVTAHFGLFQPLYFGDFTGQPRPRSARSTSALNGFALQSNPRGPGATIAPGIAPLQLSGADLEIILRSPETNEIVQVVNMKFPACQTPRPYIWADQAGTIPTGPNKRFPPPQRYENDLNSRLILGASEYDWALIRPGDVVRSMEPDSDAPPKGDLRFYAGTPIVPANWFRPGGEHADHQDLHGRGVANQFNSIDEVQGRFAHGLRQNNAWQFMGQFAAHYRRDPGNDVIRDFGGDDQNKHPYYRMSSMRTTGVLVDRHHGYYLRNDDYAVYRDAVFVTARGTRGAFRADGQPGDFDNGFGHIEDGPYINKPDEGNSYGTPFAFQGGNTRPQGGYNNRGHFTADELAINHVPNRQIASAVQFGSLPSGIRRNEPWQTLLFCPNPAGDGHPGAAGTPDHILLDWFWMPVAQPYPISQPMATSGKINLNYDIIPFRYIKRRTPIHSLLKPVQVGAIPPEAAARHVYNNYRQGVDAPLRIETRFNIDLDHARGTLQGFERKFADGDIFRSASEICDIFLVPERISGRAYPRQARRATYDGMKSWWRGFGLTGDNMRETPYNHIYPRCTTKSNTFRIHMHVQRISAPIANPNRIDLDTARITGNWRGSVLVERFVDPNDPDLPDFAKDSDESLDDHYRVRVLERKEFRPL